MKNSRHLDGSFTIPCNWDAKDIIGSNEKVVVVSVVGHSEYEAGGDKTAILSLLLGCNMSHCTPLKPLDIDKSLIHIEGWYDSRGSVVYLHLVSVNDMAIMCGGTKVVDDLYRTQEPLVANNQLHQQYIRALLLLTSVSHIIMWTHTTACLDISIITTLRTINTIRTVLHRQLSQWVKDVNGTGSEWAAAGRLCCPRLLLVFSSATLDMQELMDEQEDSGQTCTAQAALRTLEASMEEHFYRLFRRSWSITNDSAQSATALPNNQSFVFITESNATPSDDKHDAGISLLRLGLQECDNAGLVGGRKGRHPPLDVMAQHLLADRLTSNDNNEHRFSRFLQQHIKVAFSNGFDDNVGRNALAPLFVVPAMKTWLAVTNKLFHKLVTPEHDQESSEVLQELTLETGEMKIARFVCKDLVKMALEHYDKDLPASYPLSMHKTKMADCLSYFDKIAKGVALMTQYRPELVTQCENRWHKDRHGCEQLSLTGHTCQVAQTNHQSNNEQGEVDLSSHSFGVVFHKFCNCGHNGGKLKDSCDLRHINSTFYGQMGVDCCNYLASYRFPSRETCAITTHVPLTNEPVSEVMSTGLQGIGALTSSLTRRLKVFEASYGWDAVPVYTAQQTHSKDQRNSSDDSEAEPAEQHTKELAASSRNVVLSRAHSGTATADQWAKLQLEPMLNSASSADFLPLYSSWSLVCVGPSSLYSHIVGIIDQPGFNTGSNYLLPWDVRIKVTNKHDWTVVADTLKKSKGKLNLAADEFSVKVFIGCEYECIRGHRFLMSSAHTVLASKAGHPTLSATAIATQPMPLYHPCHCSNPESEASLGQLMRIHVITPKAPVRVIVNPRVQPGPSPCPSYMPQPSSEMRIRLPPASYWVLRLPTVYVGAAGPYYPPDPRQPIGVENGCLLEGCFSVSEINIDR